jgi:hypothetical protein
MGVWQFGASPDRRVHTMTLSPPTLSPRYKIVGAFWLGLATAIAIRALIVLNHVQPDWVRPVWYFAVLGNFVFFFYRYQITAKRKRAIRNYQLIEKISTNQPLSVPDRDVLVYILNSIKKSPEHLNYLVIFFFSLLAIAIDMAFVLYWNQ